MAVLRIQVTWAAVHRLTFFFKFIMNDETFAHILNSEATSRRGFSPEGKTLVSINQLDKQVEVRKVAQSRQASILFPMDLEYVGCIYQGHVCVHGPVSFQPFSFNTFMVSCNTEHQIIRFCFALGSPLGWKNGEGLIWSASVAVVAFVSHLSGWKSFYNPLRLPASCSSTSLWCKGFTSLYSTFQHQTVNLTLLSVN